MSKNKQPSVSTVSGGQELSNVEKEKNRVMLGKINVSKGNLGSMKRELKARKVNPKFTIT